MDRQVGWFVALEDASGLDTGLTVRLQKTACVTHQAAGGSEVARLMDGRHRVADSQGSKANCGLPRSTWHTGVFTIQSNGAIRGRS